MPVPNTSPVKMMELLNTASISTLLSRKSAEVLLAQFIWLLTSTATNMHVLPDFHVAPLLMPVM